MFSPLRKKSESECKPVLRHRLTQISSVRRRSPAGKGLPPGNRCRREFIAGNSEVLRPWQQKRLGRNWVYQTQFRLQLSRKIIKIFLRIAAYPVFFCCHALRTSHWLHKNSPPAPVFRRHVLPRVRFRILTEDIFDQLQRSAGLRDAPWVTQYNLYFAPSILPLKRHFLQLVQAWLTVK